jgi:hypothetical protein
MSRSTFAASFKERVGRPPLEYLIQWRMILLAMACFTARRPSPTWRR